jgi:formyl-CoA transferase
VGVGNDRQWRRLCALAGWQDLAADERFASNPDRVGHREILVPLLQKRFQERSSAEWSDALLDAGIPCGPINAIDQVFADPQILARDMLLELDHPTAGTVKLAGSPLKLSRTPVRIQEAPPLLGQHTEEILSRYLGYGQPDVAQLRAEGVI